MHGWTVLTVTVFAGCVFCATEDNSHTVETNIGTIIGFRRDADVFGETVKVSRFLGIPYADPPIGELRFQKPVPKPAFTTPFFAKQHGNICMQQHIMPTAKEIHDSEDCLYLNIYAPASSVRGELPVMIWIHGGAFVAGSADAYNADTIAGFGDVIVVTLNYRLSIWGFFSTGADTGPLNYGLWDQHLAIKWVHDNIAAFGGDTSRVTIFGESAGSASVVCQCLYEGNKGLFQRAIAQSGSINAHWASTNNPREDAQMLGRLVGCDSNEPVELYECIKSTPEVLLNSTLNNATNGFLRFPFAFIPVVDGDIYKERPEDIFDTRTYREDKKHPFFSTIDLMAGMMSAEGGGVIPYHTTGDPEDFYPNRTYFEETLVPGILKTTFGNDVAEVVIVATIAQYTDWSDPENPEKIRLNVIQLCSDLIMTTSIMESTNFHANQSREPAGTYLYQFDVNPSYHLIPTPSWLKKANHADELIYQFGFGNDGILTYQPEENATLEDWEIQLAKDMITMWTNFAKTGDPNMPTSVGQDWPAYNLATQKYFDITGNISPQSVKQYLQASNVNFWNKLIPTILKAIDDGHDMQEGSPPFAAKHEDACQKDVDCAP